MCGVLVKIINLFAPQTCTPTSQNVFFWSVMMGILGIVCTEALCTKYLILSLGKTCIAWYVLDWGMGVSDFPFKFETWKWWPSWQVTALDICSSYFCHPCMFGTKRKWSKRGHVHIKHIEICWLYFQFTWQCCSDYVLMHTVYKPNTWRQSLVTVQLRCPWSSPDRVSSMSFWLFCWC